jgi:hypothetical protein
MQRGPQARAQGVVQMKPGEKGLTRLEYIGGNSGAASYWGPVTNIHYAFGLSRPVGFVDDRDVKGLLNVVQGRRPVFRRYVAPKPVPVITPVPVAEAVSLVTPEEIDAVSGETPSLIPAVSEERLMDTLHTLAQHGADYLLMPSQAEIDAEAAQVKAVKPKRGRKPRAKHA